MVYSVVTGPALFGQLILSDHEQQPTLIRTAQRTLFVWSRCLFDRCVGRELSAAFGDQPPAGPKYRCSLAHTARAQILWGNSSTARRAFA